MIDCFSWMAWSTRKAARRAVCWAICAVLAEVKGMARDERTCLASTACVNSGENATCVIETSSMTRPNRAARLTRFSRTSLDTCHQGYIQIGPRYDKDAQSLVA